MGETLLLRQALYLCSSGVGVVQRMLSTGSHWESVSFNTRSDGFEFDRDVEILT
jgi:hypothetical protein